MDETVIDKGLDNPSVEIERPHTQLYFNELVRQRQAAYDLIRKLQNEVNVGFWRRSKGKDIAGSDTFHSEQESQLEEAKKLQDALTRGDLGPLSEHVQREVDRLIKEGNELQREIDSYGKDQIREQARLEHELEIRRTNYQIIKKHMDDGDTRISGENLILLQKDIDKAQKVLEEHPVTPLVRKKEKNRQDYEILQTIEQELGIK